MSDLLIDGTSTYVSTGTPDTQTPRSNGVNGSFADAEIVNGSAKAVVDMQGLLGNALTLKGDKADLVARLARILHSDGSIRKGTSFPSSPVPVEGDMFYRTDTNTVYFYDGSAWKTAFEGEGASTIDHGELAGLTDDDHTQYALADGSRIITGNQQFKKSVPILRIKGTEANAQEYGISEDTGNFILYENTGTDGSPTWTERAKYTRSSGLWTLTGNLTVSGGILIPTIADLTNMNHAHTSPATGGIMAGNGNISVDAAWSGTVTDSTNPDSDASVTLTTVTGSKVLLFAHLEANAAMSTSSAGEDVYVRIVRDGSMIKQYLVCDDGTQRTVALHEIFDFSFLDTPTASSHTYLIDMFQSGAGSTAFDWINVHLIAFAVA